MDFKSVNDVDQNRWNYLFFVLYLKEKEADEMNGVESYVMDKLDNDELTAWLPSKTSCAVERLGAGGLRGEEEGGEMREQMSKLSVLEETLSALMKGGVGLGGVGGGGGVGSKQVMGGVEE